MLSTCFLADHVFHYLVTYVTIVFLLPRTSRACKECNCNGLLCNDTLIRLLHQY